MAKQTDFTPLINAAAAAGNATAKVATEVAKLLKGKRKAQADTIKADAYAAFLGDRKAKDLSDAERRTYGAMRVGFFRYYATMKWNKAGGAGKAADSDGFELRVTRKAEPDTVVKAVRTLAEWLRTEHKNNERMLQLAAFLSDIE